MQPSKEGRVCISYGPAQPVWDGSCPLQSACAAPNDNTHLHAAYKRSTAEKAPSISPELQMTPSHHGMMLLPLLHKLTMKCAHMADSFARLTTTLLRNMTSLVGMLIAAPVVSAGPQPPAGQTGSIRVLHDPCGGRGISGQYKRVSSAATWQV